ncbi:MAG: transglycosylase SLT domain-containing protein [Desulfobacula sp.]|nr:transglycosylase SLT domain-containing protein [Desulfobacula sp.]
MAEHVRYYGVNLFFQKQPQKRLQNFTKKLVQNNLILIFLTASLLFFSVCITVDTQAAVNKNLILRDTDFPLYPAIKPNVDFWIRIFTKTSKSQGLLHDTKNLAIIYDTINLDDTGTSGARKKNKKIKKQAINKYKTILLSLAKGKAPATKTKKRVAALFGPKVTAQDFKNAAFNIRVQTGVKEEFRAGLIRSGAFIDDFRKVFKSHGLPVDLVYLPCVESSYQYRAYSKFGAAGIWQFTRSTGRLYMKVGYVVDERRDPYISTIAAARLLKKNYKELQEWPLAITAYNHGLNGMMRAKKSKKSYEKIFQTYRSRSFKFASRNFYAEFLAARIVGKNYKTYFGNLPFEKPKSFQTIKTKGFLPVNILSDRLGIPVSKLKTLNPALRQPVFNGQKYIPKGFELKLPETVSMKTANKKLTALYRTKQKPSRFHRVQKGDTAGAIARLHSVYLHDLILANGLNLRATIYVGQNLRIPVKGELILAEQTAASTIIKSPIAKSVVKSKPQSTPKKAVKSPPEYPISKVSKQIAKAGAIELKTKTSINPNIVTSNLNVLKIYNVSGRTIGTIKIEAEETLGHYADWLGIKTNAIRDLNKLKYGSHISVDQTIKLPMHKKTIQEFEEQRYEFHKEMEEDFFESFSIQTIEIYEIKRGDNIWNLCINELEIPFWLLKKYNPKMNFQTLIPNQKINYPIITKKKIE